MLQLKKFPDIPVSTREKAQESRPHPEEPRFRLLSREEGSFHCVIGKEFPAFPSHLTRRRSPQERREELQGRATIPRVSRSLSPFRETCFPCTASTFKPRIDSHHGGRGTALWEGLVGKPRGQATVPLFHAKGSAMTGFFTGKISLPTRSPFHPSLQSCNNS